MGKPGNVGSSSGGNTTQAHQPTDVIPALRTPTGALLAAICVVSACVVAGLTGVAGLAAPAGAAGPVTLVQTWMHDLDDAPCGVALASPVVDHVGGNPVVEFGDRQGDIYAFGVSNGSVPAGWGESTDSPVVGSGQGCDVSVNGGASLGTPAYEGVSVPENSPIDSTASVVNSNLYFGAGNAAAPALGGYWAYGPGGNELWNQIVENPPGDNQPDGGVLASPAVAENGAVVEAGSLGQETYALNTSDGSNATGWPQFSADSVFSTAAVGDLYGSGQDDFVVGGASSPGEAYGVHYAAGGHLRIYNQHGGLVCEANPNEEVDSSPAVGPILPGGAYGIATGTGSFYNGVSDEDTVKVYDTACNQVWSDKLDGVTMSSPALSDVEGDGSLAVVEGTNIANSAGSVWALNAANGAVLWSTRVTGAVIGSVTTADLTGEGYQDVVVPTTHGIDIIDGRTGAMVDEVDGNGQVYGFQNSPLITADPNGSIGITVAGYFAIAGTPYVQGMVQHFEVANSSSSWITEPGSWLQFHHDSGLSGFVAGSDPAAGCAGPAGADPGYSTVASDGGIFSFGQPFCGSTGSIALNKPVVGMAQTPGRGGYWLVASDGGIFCFGDAGFYGSTGSLHLNAPVVGMAATHDGGGYWLVASDGGIFSFGDAGFYGSAASVPGQDIVGMAPSPDGGGYWEVSTTGRVFAYGDAIFQGDASGLHLNAPIVGITPDPVTGGYWLIGGDGGVFSFGAPFYGSTGNIRLNAPVVSMQSTDDGQGYWFVASDGGVFSYGDAPFEGSMGGQRLNKPMVGMSGF